MDVEFVLKPEDIVAFSKYHSAHLPKAWRAATMQVWPLVLMVFGGGLLFQLLDLVPLLYHIICLAYFTLFVILWACAMVALRNSSLRQKINQGAYARYRGWRRISINPQSLIAVDEHSRSETRWAGVEKIVRTDGHVFLYLSDVSATIVPARAFAKTEFEQFVTTARQFWKAARDDQAVAAESESGAGPQETNIKAD